MKGMKNMERVFAVSDLHGNYELWEKIKEFLDQDDKLYILGDCGDRCADGWKIIKEALADPRVTYIRGNHDQMLLDAWKNEWCGDDLYLWMYNGGQPTYDAIVTDPDYALYLPQLARTKLYECYKNNNGQKIHLSHAGFTLHENDEIPEKRDLLWDRGHIEDACDWWPKSNPNDYVVHGHTPTKTREFRRLLVAFPDYYNINKSQTVIRYAHEHKICIDGAAFLTNCCALLNLDTLQEIVISTDL